MNCLKKKLLYGTRCLLFVFFPVISIAQSSKKMSATDWRNDLEYFKQLIHTRYSNLFYNVTARQFDSAVAATDKKIESLSDLQMKVEFTKLVAMFRIGHTAVRLREGPENNLTAWVHSIPVEFYLFADGIYIRSIANKYKEALGGKIVKIGNAEISTALHKIRPLVPYENEQGFLSSFSTYLTKPELLQAVGITDNPTTVPITYTKDGIEKKLLIEAEELGLPRHGARMQPAKDWSDAYPLFNTDKSALWLKNPSRLRFFEYLPESKSLYVRHSAVLNETDETIADFFTKVFRFVDDNDVDKLILDIRLNGGGNNYLNKPVITGIIQSRKINRPGHFFVVIGRQTFSAAQNLSNELEKYTEAVFVGEPTSENINFYGDTRSEMLPNSQLNMNLSWLWWQNLDPRDKRQWKVPHLAADLSFEDYVKGNDPALKLIMNYKDEGPIDDKLRDLVIADKYNEAVAMAKKYLENPSHRYFKNELETKINDFGYRLFEQKRFEQANKVLNMNIQLFPESANAYDSYAESWLKLGNKEEAIKYYKIAISKDPKGTTGENAKKILEQLQAKDAHKGL